MKTPISLTLALIFLIQAAECQSSNTTISLSVYYSYTLEDNDVTATEAEADQAQQLGYTYTPGSDGLIYAAASATPLQTAPLKRYLRISNGKSRDTLLVATAAGIAYAEQNNYTYIGIDGYVLTSNATCNTSCPALEQWYSSERQDNFLVGAAVHRADAVSAGYTLARIEGYQALQTVPPSTGWYHWPSQPPPSCIFNQSDLVAFVEFNFGSNANYGGADTWYPSWGADDRMYTSWTDGSVKDMVTGKLVTSSSGGSGADMNSTTGFAIVEGDDPLNLVVTNVNVFASSTTPYQGRYPSASFFHNGVWYYGTYTLDNPSFPPNPPPNCGNWCVQGPFVGFRMSTDFGATWHEPRVHMTSPTDNLFNETAKNNAKVKFGAPHIVDLGQELQYSPDGKVYLIGHGAQRPEAHQSWMQGDQVYLARAEPNPATINSKDSWEFFAGNDASGTPTWVAGNVTAAQPLFTWNNHTGVVTMTYVAALKRYVMVVSTPTFSPYTVKQFDTYMLESQSMTGPFRLIAYLSEFGPEAYFVHYPSKFLNSMITTANITTGRTAPVLHGYLSYSANFAMGTPDPLPPGSGYHWSLQEMRFVLQQ